MKKCMATDRIDFIDRLKGAAILAVVLMHCHIYDGLNTFMIPCFFVVAGYMMYVKGDVNTHYALYLKKRFKSLMYPYAVFSFYYMAYFVYKALIRGDSSVSPLEGLIQTVLLSGIGVLWFLPCLFMGEVVTFALLKSVGMKRSTVIAVLGLLFSAFAVKAVNLYYINIAFVPLCLIKTFLRAIIAACYTVIGFCFGTFWSIVSARRGIKVICGVICLLIYGVLNQYAFVDFNTLSMHHPYDFFIYVPLSLISFIGFFLVFEAMGQGRDVLTFFGKNSLIVMFTHIAFAFTTISMSLAARIVESDIYRVLLTVVIMLGLECITVLIFNKYFSFLYDYNKLKKVRRKE